MSLLPPPLPEPQRLEAPPSPCLKHFDAEVSDAALNRVERHNNRFVPLIFGPVAIGTGYLAASALASGFSRMFNAAAAGAGGSGFGDGGDAFIQLAFAAALVFVMLRNVRLVGRYLGARRRPLDHPRKGGAPGFSTGPCSVRLGEDWIEFARGHQTERLHLAAIAAVRQLDGVLILRLRNSMAHVFETMQNENERRATFRELAQAVARARPFRRRGGWTIDPADPGHVHVPARAANAAVAEWRRQKGLPLQASLSGVLILTLVNALFFSAMVLPSLRLLASGEAPKWGVFLPGLCFLPLVLHTLFLLGLFLRGKLGLTPQVFQRSPDVECGAAIVRVEDGRIHVARRLLTVSHDIAGLDAVCETAGLLVLSSADCPVEVLPLRPDLERALAQAGLRQMRGPWGEYPTEGAGEAVPC